MSNNSSGKYKVTVRMNDETEQEIRDYMEASHTKSINAFILKSINFYLGYLKQGKNLNYISPILASAIKSEIKTVEENLSEMLFKVAVQISVGNQIMGDVNEFTNDYIEKLENWCAERVASTNGIITLADTLERENQYTEYDYMMEDE